MRLKSMFGLAAILMVGSLLSAGKLRAQQAPPPPPASTSAAAAGGDTLQTIDFTRSRVFVPYHSPEIPEITMSNSERLHSLINNGKMELSLDDAIALALENNLDIALSRYSLIYAKIDILRTAAGGTTRGINPGLFGAVTAFGSSSGGGGGGGTGGAGGFSGGASAVSVGNWGCCDPVAGVSFGWDRNSSPLNYTTLAGVPVSTAQGTAITTFIGKGFLTGTSVAAFVSADRIANNQLGQLFDPYTPTGLTLGFSQPLLNGFGYRANAKYIRIARNDLRQADSVFKQQVITTVANVANLYSDLVSFKEGVRVAEQTLASAQKLLSDNKRQVEIGTLAPITVVQAESEVANDEQALIVAQTQYQQQQELLKTAISKHVDADLVAATVEPTDKLPEPKPDDIPALETALHEAEQNRPELVQRDLDVKEPGNHRSGVEKWTTAIPESLWYVVAERAFRQLAGVPSGESVIVVHRPVPEWYGNQRRFTQSCTKWYLDFALPVFPRRLPELLLRLVPPNPDPQPPGAGRYDHCPVAATATPRSDAAAEKHHCPGRAQRGNRSHPSEGPGGCRCKSD